MLMNEIKSILLNGNKFIRNITADMKIVDTQHAEYFYLQNQVIAGNQITLKDVLRQGGTLYNTNEVVNGYTYTTNIYPFFTAVDENGVPWIIANAQISWYSTSEGDSGITEVILFKANDVKLKLGGGK